MKTTAVTTVTGLIVLVAGVYTGLYVLLAPAVVELLGGSFDKQTSYLGNQANLISITQVVVGLTITSLGWLCFLWCIFSNRSLNSSTHLVIRRK